MDLALLTAFFGWMTLINVALLAISAALLTLGRGWVGGLHARISGLEQGELDRLYMSFLAQYKIAVLMLNLVPYLALRLVV